MNAADYRLQQVQHVGYTMAGSFPISMHLATFLPESVSSLVLIERFFWWFHILGIFGFLLYLPHSKHLHILLAFPNTYFGSLSPKGKMDQMESVTQEVRAMVDPSFVPTSTEPPARFGAKDVHDLTWKNLLDAFTCTECGRCTSVCPAHITGKALSPRKIMMDTRDRLEEVMNPIASASSERQLLDDFIQREEIWACTSCNACVEACPVMINPLDIILQLRRFTVMEESKAPSPILGMLNNVENNGAPWKYAQADRAAWRNPYISSSE
jgi:heterodisulfide reductase subunit C